VTPRSTALATVPTESDAPALPERAGDILSSPAAFQHALALSQTLAKSQLLPQAFRGKPEDVFMAILLAQKMGEDVFTILNNVHFVNGKPGWGAPFLIARANASGVFTGPLEFEVTGEGESLAVTCSAVSKATGKRLSKTVTMKMARADGWLSNKKYQSIPEQMLSYRAATFFIRLYCPSVLYGFRPVDELEDVEAARGRKVETSYEDPPHASPPSRSSRSPRPGESQAALPPRGQALQAAAREDGGPSLALPQRSSPPDPGGAGVSATSSTAASAGAAGPDGLEGFESPTPATPSPSTPVPGGDPAAQAAGPGEGQRQHDPSFTREEQRRFFAKVGELGLNKDLVCELAATRPGNARPSQMGQVRRDRFLAWLQTPDGVAAYEQLLEQKEREAQADVDLVDDVDAAESAAEGVLS
jgi:hypothetical protein